MIAYRLHAAHLPAGTNTTALYIKTAKPAFLILTLCLFSACSNVSEYSGYESAIEQPAPRMVSVDAVRGLSSGDLIW